MKTMEIKVNEIEKSSKFISGEFEKKQSLKSADEDLKKLNKKCKDFPTKIETLETKNKSLEKKNKRS